MSAYLVDFSRSGGDLVYGLFHGRLKSSQVYCYGGGLRNVFRELTHQTCTFLPAPGSTPKARGAPNSVRSHFRDFRILETIQISKISNSKKKCLHILFVQFLGLSDPPLSPRSDLKTSRFSKNSLVHSVQFMNFFHVRPCA
ncbi:unnamed protein product [Tenebrio molitor]|jgi:hypothetical protein|nr:unnamed protein product [Tenebrio molitor]